MTGWYDPIQLANTAFKVIVSAMLRERADMRVIESVTAQQPRYYYPAVDEQLWIDYAADVGDGFNSTYAVARALAERTLKPSGCEESLERGRVIVLGGDLVYPTAGRRAYDDRIILPYEHAFPKPSEEVATAAPELFAIPGNHDWYDGLPAFLRLFCGGRTHGALRTRQARSYFTMRLPYRWWLIAVDMQLTADVDRPQLDYILESLREIDDKPGMQQGDQVILCLAEPAWVHDTRSKTAKKEGPSYELSNNLQYLERKIYGEFKGEVRLWLAGDLHHYRHHRGAEQANKHLHKITCGGGGAFTLGTHHLDEDLTSPSNGKIIRYEQQKAYPCSDQSKQLIWRVWLFNCYNPRFGIVTGIVYAMFGWLLLRRLQSVDLAIGNLWAAISEAAVYLVTQRPSGAIFALVLLIGAVMFTKSNRALYRFTMGPIHGAVHLLAALVAAWVAGALMATLGWSPLPSTLLMLFAMFAAGALIGPFLLGAYLFVSCRVFKHNANETFSAIRNTNYKSFLRLRLNEQGLTVYPIGIDEPPRYKSRTGTPNYGMPPPDTKLIEDSFTIPNPR